MASVEPLSFSQFNARLRTAAQRFQKRFNELSRLVAIGTVYIFGYGGKGRTLALQIRQSSDAKVVVYDSSPNGRRRAAEDGFDIVCDADSLKQSNCGVILGACQAQVEQAAIIQNNYIYYQEAAYLFDTAHLESKAREFSAWIPENSGQLFDTYLLLHPSSREAFLHILMFRLSLDPSDLATVRNLNSDMWFDVPEHRASRKYQTFLDVGAYDGDTLRHARSRLLVRRGIAVEANTSLFDAIQRVAKTYEEGIMILPRAAWSHSCRLSFSEVRGGMITVTESNQGELDAGPIDEMVKEQVDLIKMDVEGAEVRALTGCLNTLKTCPDLAIAAYHRPDDLAKIPMFLQKAGYTTRDFDWHIGHYSDCLDDSILYCLKRAETS